MHLNTIHRRTNDQEAIVENQWDHYFDVVTASTPALLNEAYALRYQVYCVEHSFENPANYPDEREVDRYDAYSRHVALMYRPSGEIIGTVRLIPQANPVEPSLPLLALLGKDARAELLSYPVDRVGEISRYAVLKSFRRRKGEDEFPDLGLSQDEANCRRLLPHLTLGLMRGILKMAVSQQVSYLCACMRPALLRLFRQLGMKFRSIGPPVDYHGFRQPCVGSVDDLLLGLKTHRAEWSRVVQGGVQTRQYSEVAPS